MKYYLSNILPRLKKFSASLDQSALLVDKPWVVSSVDEEDEGPRTTLIFRQDGRLHVSIEGEVHDGSWEYLPEAQAMLIKQRGETHFYKHAYMDEAVLVLKKDTSNKTGDYYLLADENRVPDGDVVGYLIERHRQRLQSEGAEVEAVDGDAEQDQIRKSPAAGDGLSEASDLGGSLAADVIAVLILIGAAVMTIYMITVGS